MLIRGLLAGLSDALRNKVHLFLVVPMLHRHCTDAMRITTGMLECLESGNTGA